MEDGGSIADIIEGVDLSDPRKREEAIVAVRALEERRRVAGIEAARNMGLPERTTLPDGRVQEVAGVDHRGRPVYFTTHNANSAISSGAKILNGAPYFLDGVSSLTAGVWDGGTGRASHQEFGGRVSLPDGAGFIDHATHVIGTMAASGVVPNAKGAAPAMPISSYDWNSDRSEMLGTGAATAGEAVGGGKFLVSNHSYGYVSGWNYVDGGSPYRLWEWWGDAGGAGAVESDFGMYNTYARDTDSLAAGLPYYLMVRSAGNERNNNPAAGQVVALSPGSETVATYDPSIHPAGDGSYRGGYDNVSFDALAKNVITVGSGADAVNGGVRDPARGNVSSFSCFGPVDDGRVKPDVVANGESLYSPTSASNSSYGTLSGTSMAAPGVAGLAMLLAEDFVARYGFAMRASTLKGLLIHTADDRGNAGPDYQYGWGLVDGVEAADLIRDHHTNPGKKRIVEDSMPRTGAVENHSFTWDGVSPIRVTISWTDPAGTATTVHDSRVSRLRNNLNLRVVAPDGTGYQPYVMPFVGTWTTEALSQPAVTGVNNTDNVEQVLIPNPGQQGTWTVEVSRGGTFTSDQSYSLLITGSAVKEAAVVTLSGLTHTYDGGYKSVNVATVPVGLAVTTTYNGNATTPTEAGSYQVVATVTSALYTGEATGTMTVSKADQTVSLDPFGTKTLGDAPFQVTASSSSGLPLNYSSSDSSIADISSSGMITMVGVGTVQITAAQPGDNNHSSASTSRTLSVGKASGTVSFTGLSAVYDSSPKPVGVITSPPGLDAIVTYDGDGEAPSEPGSYLVRGEIQDANYQGEAEATLTILDAVNGTTFEQWRNSLPPEAANVSGEQDDPDLDGVPNLAEFHLGTDPLDSSSKLGITILSLGVGHNTIRFSPVSDRGVFLLERWTGLGGAPTVEPFSFTAVEMSSGEAIRQIPSSGDSGYYRLLYSPPQ
jgi:hypothetical protein